MSLEADLTLDDYIHIIKRRFPYVIGVFFLVFLLTTAYAIKLPPVRFNKRKVRCRPIRSSEAGCT